MYVDDIDEGNITHIGMEREIAVSKNPIVTNGIATCMGIGMHIDDKNYFEHIPDWNNASAGQQWNELITTKYTGTKMNMYVFIFGHTIPDIKKSFFDKITENMVIIIIVNWGYKINKVKVPCYFPDYGLKVGMNKYPFGFYEVEYKEQKRLEEEEQKRLEEEEERKKQELFLNKIVKLKNPTPINEKMRWRVNNYHEVSGNPMCELVIDSKGNETKRKISVIMNLNNLEITELV